MKHKLSYILAVIFFSASFCACSQDDNQRKPIPTIREHRYSFGSSPIVIKETTYTTGLPFLFLHLHSNETTASNAASQLSDSLGIDYVQLVNNGSRLIEFDLANTKYRFDPNRIFSKAGIRKTLELYSRSSEKAFQYVHYFRDFFLGTLNIKKTIIAVHNNSDDEFSMNYYEQNKLGTLHINAVKDKDDFFITTDSTLFRRLKEKNFNVVLEYTSRLKDDGSLSIFCGKAGIAYINVEAEHGHLKEQREMLETVIEILRENKK